MEWHDHGVMGMIKNEKYKGDVLLGKTFPLLNQKSRLTDLLIDGKIEQEDYDERLEIPGMLCIVEPVMPIRLRY